jgi:hypothetical protein
LGKECSPNGKVLHPKIGNELLSIISSRFGVSCSGNDRIPQIVCALSLFLLVGIVVAGIVKKELRFRWNFPATIFIALYLCYGIGVFFTDYLDLGLKALEYKLSLLLFPFVFSFVPKKSPPLELIGAGFLIGLLTLIHSGDFSFYHTLSRIE